MKGFAVEIGFRTRRFIMYITTKLPLVCASHPKPIRKSVDKQMQEYLDNNVETRKNVRTIINQTLKLKP